MRIVHLADLHLGYRQYQRLTPAGINQREADVALAFTRVADRIIALQPDLVLVAGDVFHAVRPANPAILHAFAQFARLVRELPAATIVMIAGNHDTPRSRDTVCILRLFSQLGITVVDGEPRRIDLPAHDASILCVPDVVRLDIALAPEPQRRHNILLLHGEPRGLLPSYDGNERASLIIEPEDVRRPEWTYVALGHYHVHRQVGPRAWYPGSIEYTSTNPWGELREEHAARLPGKGFIEFDSESEALTFHHVPGARSFIDLPAIEGRGLGASDLDSRIAAAVDVHRGGIDGHVVRLVLRDVPRHLARDLNHRAIREYRARALQFQLDVRPPEAVRVEASGAPGRPASLAHTVAERLREHPLDAELSREEFVATGLTYLAQADAQGGPGGAETA